MIGFVLAMAAALAPLPPALREQSFTTLAALPAEARGQAASELAQGFARRNDCQSARRALGVGGAEFIPDNDLRNTVMAAARGSDRACASALTDLLVGQARVSYRDDRVSLGDALMFAGALRIRIGEVEAGQALVAAGEAAILAGREASKDPAGAEADRKLDKLIAALTRGSEPHELAEARLTALSVLRGTRHGDRATTRSNGCS